MKHKADGKDKGWGLSARGETQVLDLQKGRWPANIILSHSPDCVCVGTKQIKSNSRPNCYGKEYKRSEGHQVAPGLSYNPPEYADENGQETIEVYACVPDCPIRIMDTQSGRWVFNYYEK